METELLLYDQFLSTDVLCTLPNEIIPMMRNRFVVPRLALATAAGNISQIASCRLTPEEQKIADESHKKRMDMRNLITSAAKAFGKDAHGKRKVMPNHFEMV